MSITVVSGYYDPSMSATLLPACATPGCGSPHPLAIKNLSDKSQCPQCKAPASTPGKTVTEVASLSGGPVIFFARVLLAMGRFFHRLSGG